MDEEERVIVAGAPVAEMSVTIVDGRVVCVSVTVTLEGMPSPTIRTPAVGG